MDYGLGLFVVSLLAAAALTALFVVVLRRSPWALVLFACFLQVAALLAAAGIAHDAGNSTLAVILVAAASLVAVVLYLSRDSLGLVSRLLGLAALALRDNPLLLLVVGALNLALAAASTLILSATAVVAAGGDVLPNPLRQGNPRCATPDGQPVTCCVVAPAAALPVYLAVAGLTLAWTLGLLFELKVYVVSGVVAQWYFSPAGHLAGGTYSPDCSSGGYSGRRSLAASLGHALGPSFGSVCAASAVLGSTTYPRAVYSLVSWRPQPEQRSHAGGCGGWLLGCLTCVWCCCSCCCSCVMAFLAQLTKYATVQMAMSGLDFWRSSSEVVNLLSRNMLDAYNMWWYLPTVLHCAAAAIAGTWGYGAYWLGRVYWAHFMHDTPLSAAQAAALGVMASGIAMLALSFVCAVLVNITDALFICYVLDRDSAAITWWEAHSVYSTLPCCVSAASAVSELEGSQHSGVAPTYYVQSCGPYGYSGTATAYGNTGAATATGYPHGIGIGIGAQVPRPAVYRGTSAGQTAGGFWGWLRSPRDYTGFYGSSFGARNDRPHFQPPTVLSPPYAEQGRYMRPPAGPPQAPWPSHRG